MPKIIGKAFHCGDFVDTDVMSPGRFEPYEGPEQLARVALCDYPSKVPFVDPETSRSPYTVIIAGTEFGCGSSRETAPQALHYAGARAVIARSFARIFFRNCVNMGLLLPIVCDHSFGEEVVGTTVEINPDDRSFVVGAERYTFPDFGPLSAIVEAGGLLEHTKRRLEASA